MHFKNRFVNIFFTFFTYQDALQYDSGTNDFIFTGLPFFTLELYPNVKYDNCNKRNKELKYVEKDERGQKLWVKNWLAPLIKKLMKSLNQKLHRIVSDFGLKYII